ncbi:MAG: WYL domain-containing protein [Eubacteriales bacterium]|nr:WYL domain-containing protein [Eubacteriales bacterium]
MVSRSAKKLKILYMMKFLLENSDEDHPVTLEAIQQDLQIHGIEAERKSIYNDINLLREYGLDIANQRGRDSNYRLLSRPFELAELKLLVDAVESSRFVTAKKTRELVAKIAGLTSKNQAKSLQHQLIRTGKIKASNESVLYTIDTLHQAIDDDRQISFRYQEYTINKQIRFRRSGERYHVSPYAMTWDDENYYLIAHYERYGRLSQFRIDRMNDVQISHLVRDRIDSTIDLGEYVRSTFGMFSGEPEDVQIRFDQSLIQVVVDRFGQNIVIHAEDENSFTVYLKVVVSPTFWGWLFQFGGKVRVLSPAHAVDAYRLQCEQVIARLNE